MDKFTEVYKKLIMQEDWGPEGINTSAIGAPAKAYVNGTKSSSHPDDPNWYNKDIVETDLDWDQYEQIIKDIRYDDYTVEDLLSNIEYFIHNKKGERYLKKFVKDLEITDEDGLFTTIIDSMIEFGVDAFKSQNDFKHAKIFEIMDKMLYSDKNISLLEQSNVDLKTRFDKLGLLNLIK